MTDFKELREALDADHAAYPHIVTFNAPKSTIRALLAELDAARKDAGRWRALSLKPDEVLVALRRGEDYDDVHPELISEDAIGDRWPEYRTIDAMKEQQS